MVGKKMDSTIYSLFAPEGLLRHGVKLEIGLKLHRCDWTGKFATEFSRPLTLKYNNENEAVYCRNNSVNNCRNYWSNMEQYFQ